MTRFVEFGDMIINVAHIVSATQMHDGSVRIKLSDGDIYVEHIESPTWWDDLWGASDIIEVMPGTGFMIESPAFDALEPVACMVITADGVIRPMRIDPETGDFEFYPNCCKIFLDNGEGCE